MVPVNEFSSIKSILRLGKLFHPHELGIDPVNALFARKTLTEPAGRVGGKGPVNTLMSIINSIKLES